MEECLELCSVDLCWEKLYRTTCSVVGDGEMGVERLCVHLRMSLKVLITELVDR